MKKKTKPDLICHCGHSRRLHDAPAWFKKESNMWIEFACYKGPRRIDKTWPCGCHEFKVDNLLYLERKYEQRASR